MSPFIFNDALMEGRDLSDFYALFGEQTVFVPVDYGTKKCHLAWRGILFPQTQTSEYLKSLLEGNLGVLVGEASADLISIDCDGKQLALLMLEYNPWLADTLATHGQKGCNFWLRMVGSYPKKIRRFDPKKPMGEWRGGGGYVVVDGRHPSGCLYTQAPWVMPLAVPYSQIKWPPIFDPPDQSEGDEEPIWPFSSDCLMIPTDERVKPQMLIEGLLHRGNKMIVSGGSKTFKTWALTDLGLSVAAGTPWLGFKCHKARVFYINFEIQTPFYAERLDAIRAAKQLPLEVGQFFFWTLRGWAVPLEDLLDALKAEFARLGVAFDLIIFDPIYKTYGALEENVASDMASLMNQLDRLCATLGIAVVFGAHFSKGNQAARDVIDRTSGSGVFGRDPDSIITLTKHEEPDCFTVDLILRHFADVDSFVVQWNYPLLTRKDALDPGRLKTIGGRPPKATQNDILNLIKTFDDQLASKDLVQKAGEEFGIARRSVYNTLKRLQSAKLIFKSKLSDHWNFFK